jgi:hypothetical protein
MSHFWDFSNYLFRAPYMNFLCFSLAVHGIHFMSTFHALSELILMSAYSDSVILNRMNDSFGFSEN